MGSVQRNDLTIYHDRQASWWDHEDPIFKPLHNLVPARLAFFDRMNLPWEAMRVLDVGCGGGYMSDALARRGAQVTGLDIAEGALEAARLHAQACGLSLELIHASADCIPLPEASVDCVVCTDVLVHVPNPEAVIHEIGRVLKPGGRFFFSSMNRTWLARLILITLGEDLLRIVYPGTHDPAKFILPTELAGFLERSGLQLEATEGIGPVGLRWSEGLVFGRFPSQAIMYQGVARRLGSEGPLKEAEESFVDRDQS